MNISREGEGECWKRPAGGEMEEREWGGSNGGYRLRPPLSSLINKIGIFNIHISVKMGVLTYLRNEEEFKKKYIGCFDLSCYNILIHTHT